jgi:hypothetical protein
MPSFGAAASVPAFGAASAAAAPFGAAATPAFGAAASSPFGGSTFGAGAAAPFGAASTPAFGATSTFGAAAPFGTPAASSPAFGAAAASPFGGTAMFGAAGGAQQQQQGAGTRNPIYVKTLGPDSGSGAGGTAQVTFNHISAMPAYSAKSPEELRFEDYSQGVKGGTGQPPAAASPGGTFSFPQSAATPAFGQGMLLLLTLCRACLTYVVAALLCGTHAAGTQHEEAACVRFSAYGGDGRHVIMTLRRTAQQWAEPKYGDRLHGGCSTSALSLEKLHLLF